MDNLNVVHVVAAVLPPPMIELLVVLAIAAAIKRFWRELLDLAGLRTETIPRDRPSSLFESRPYLFTQAENAFLRALEQAVGSQFRITMKVRLGDLVMVRGNSSSATISRNQINQKHVDFVLCTRDPVKPLLAIELDDASHDTADRQNRVDLVDTCLDGAGLPILHVRCRHSYDVAQLGLKIKSLVGSAKGLGLRLF
jgi:hypothetical protein